MILLLTSFLDVGIGCSGIICVLVTLIIATVLGYDKTVIRGGVYSYSSLLVGLSLSVYFQFNFNFVLLLILASFITFFLTLWLSAFTARFQLPFLSLPFVIGVWLILLNARTFDTSFIQPRILTGSIFTTTLFDHLPLINLYFESMGSILFQHSLIAGMLITLGLLIYSRIAFSLSLIGFLCGYLFFKTMHASLPDSDFLYSSFNYIFTAIALGGYVFIPSTASYILVIISTPVTGFMVTALFKISEPFYLPLFSFPFSLATLLLLGGLNKRYLSKFLHAVQYQLYSPEKNLYAYHTYMERFSTATFINIQLPFYGEWFVSQAHGGEITHKDDWQYAWDFVVSDENKHTFRFPGKQVSDFYCYGLPVLSPGEGTVVTILDDIEDNKIGDVNVLENWGNTIIIKHTDLLYSKLSHMKKGSFKVKVGDHVKKGEQLALCGNSGRSPEPHIHFQQQASAYIGAKTLKYPISYYITKKDNRSILNSFTYPEEGESIYRPTSTPLLSQAFHLVPGMKLNFNVNANNQQSNQNWEVFTDANNNTYLYCETTKSTAYFVNNDTLFYFTSFIGDKTSLLYYFYLAAYKVLLSYIPDIEITDTLPINGGGKAPVKLLQDFLAPFYIFMKPIYKAVFVDTDNIHNPTTIQIKSSINTNNSTNKTEFKLEISENKIKTLEVYKNNTCILNAHIS